LALGTDLPGQASVVCRAIQEPAVNEADKGLVHADELMGDHPGPKVVGSLTGALGEEGSERSGVARAKDLPLSCLEGGLRPR
jgi:hypothetical protein